MINRIATLLKKYQELISYGFWGIMTIFVNIVLFWVFSLFINGIFLPNTISFLLTVLFAYVVNTKFVFHDTFTGTNFAQFFWMRFGTIVIDNVGMMLLTYFGTSKFVAKLIINVIIILINYLCSKYLIFVKKDKDGVL